MRDAKRCANRPLPISSRLEGLINRTSSGVAEFASLVGCNGLSGQLVSTDVSGAVNMLILSLGAHHNIEPAAMRKWTPGLRTETLLILGQDINNWAYVGPEQHDMTFNTKLYGSENVVRREVGSLLGINVADAVALLRYHSAGDVECLSKTQLEIGHNGRAPRFTIYATTLAERIKSVCSGPLFFSDVRAETAAY